MKTIKRALMSRQSLAGAGEGGEERPLGSSSEEGSQRWAQ